MGGSLNLKIAESDWQILSRALGSLGGALADHDNEWTAAERTIYEAINLLTALLCRWAADLSAPGTFPASQPANTLPQACATISTHIRVRVFCAASCRNFMRASSPSNYGKVVVDDQLSKYLYRYGSDSGILVARPLR